MPKIAAIEGRIAEMQKATVTAEDRCTAITRELADFRGPSGADVSAALLAGHSATTAAVAGPSKEALETERASLREGIRDLTNQVENARRDIFNIRGSAHLKLNPICEPLAEELMVEAREAAGRIIAVYASLEAIAWTTKFGWHKTSGIKDVVFAMMTGAAVAPFQREIAVPVEISAALQALDGKGAALPASFRATISMT